MARIEFKTEWLTQIGLLSKCGEPDDVVNLCVAIQRASLGEDVGELAPMVELLFNPIAEDIEQMSDLKKKRANAGSEGGKQKVANCSKSVAKTKQNVAKDNKEKEEEREEDGEAERESEKEKFPHTPLKEKDKEKGEEGEEEKEEEREISCALALPVPEFVAESDPKRMTDGMLEQEFNALWMLYPRKDGRKDALRHYKAARREGVTFDEVESGIKRYADYVRDKDPTYTAMGSTWFCGHRWEDRIENHGPRPGSMAWLANIANGGALDDS